MNLNNTRIEVMHFLEQKIENIIAEFLKSPEECWQPAELLPESSSENFGDQIKELQAQCKELPYDYLAVLIGDVITEEALPTYESWLLSLKDHTINLLLLTGVFLLLHKNFLQMNWEAGQRAAIFHQQVLNIE